MTLRPVVMVISCERKVGATFRIEAEFALQTDAGAYMQKEGLQHPEKAWSMIGMVTAAPNIGFENQIK